MARAGSDVDHPHRRQPDAPDAPTHDGHGNQRPRVVELGRKHGVVRSPDTAQPGLLDRRRPHGDGQENPLSPPARLVGCAFQQLARRCALRQRRRGCVAGRVRDGRNVDQSQEEDDGLNAETAEHAKTARATAAGVAGRSAMAATASQSQTFDRGRLCCGAVGAIAARERAGRTLSLFRVFRVFFRVLRV